MKTRGILIAASSVLLATSSCSSLSDKDQSNLAPKDQAIIITEAAFSNELPARIGQPVTLEGVIVRGNFTYLVCPADIGFHGADGVPIHASPDNAKGLDVIASVKKLPHLARVQVTGQLYEFDGAKPDKSK